MVSEGGRGSFLDACYQSKEIPYSSSVNLPTDTLTFLCVCLQTLGQITFAHNFPFRTDFPTAASLRTVVRCFVNLDQLDDLTQNDSIERLVLLNIKK